MVLATETLMSSMGRHPPADRRLIEQVVAYLRHASLTYHDAVDLAARGGLQERARLIAADLSTPPTDVCRSPLSPNVVVSDSRRSVAGDGSDGGDSEDDGSDASSSSGTCHSRSQSHSTPRAQHCSPRADDALSVHTESLNDLGHDSATHARGSGDTTKRETFTVKLASYDAAKEFTVAKEICAITQVRLMESKAFLQSLPKVFKKGVPFADAEKMREKLVAVGAEVVLESEGVPPRPGRSVAPGRAGDPGRIAHRERKGVNQFGVAKGATGDISSQGKGKGFRNGFDEGEASTGVGKSRVGFVWRGSVAAAMSDDNNDSTGVGQGVCHNSDDGKGVGKGVGKGDDTKGVCKGWGRFARPPNN